MAATNIPQEAIPHLVNDAGVGVIRIHAKEFKCMGASPPFDHPHIFLAMGASSEITCPYCSTQYLYDDKLEKGCTHPEKSLYIERQDVDGADGGT